MDDKERYETRSRRSPRGAGDAHVAPRDPHTTPLSAEFQDLITRYAGRDLDASRSRCPLAARFGTMIAIGRWEEFQMHAAAAVREGGFSLDDLKEIVLQQAIYCGVPAAHHALKLLPKHAVSDRR